MRPAEKFAKIIRVISVPPVMISALLLILAICKPTIYRNAFEIMIAIFLLGFFPVLAYPVHHFIPYFKEKGRECQRTLAFVFSLIGYTLALVWALLFKVSSELQLVCSTYFLSVVILTLINKVLKKRASGHACSVTGPFLSLVFLVNWKLIFPCMLLAALICWASLYLRRHTGSDLALGALACIIAFLLSYFFIIF